MAKRRRKTRTHLKGPNNSASAATTGPKSFVIRSGKVGRSVGDLVRDVRNVMEPNTATRLRERTSNRLRDFLTMCGPLGVSHLIMFSQKHSQDGSDSTAWGNINMRIARAPRGPTCTFRINKFALAKDVIASQRRPRAPGGEYTTPPLLVLNNFGSQEKHVRLLVTVFQNLFPPIHVQSMKLSQARRIVLLNYNEATGTIDLRHYLISVRPVGVSRRVRRVIEGTSGRAAVSSSSNGGSGSSAKRRLVNLADTGDIADWILGRASGAGAGPAGGGPGSEVGSGFETDASSASEAESENEDGVPSNHVDLPSSYMGRGNVGGSKRAIRLRELGPRIEMRCIKIEEGIPGAGKSKGEREGGHEVLWHDYVKKSSSEAAKLRKSAEEKREAKEKRRKEQEDNVKRKEEEKAKRKGKGKKEEGGEAEESDEEGEEQAQLDVAADEEDDDEFAYEDRFAPKDQDGQGEGEGLFDEGGELDEEDSVGEMSEAEDEEEEGEEEEDEEEDEEDEGSDTSPVPIGRMMHDSDIDDEAEAEWGDEDDEDEDEESEEEQELQQQRGKAKKAKLSSASASASASKPKPKATKKTQASPKGRVTKAGRR